MDISSRQLNCKHDFKFVECFGTFCSKCDIGYGVECLNPECKEHNCGKHNLMYDVFANERGITFDNVVQDMNDDIYLLSLGHDGVIEGKVEDVRIVLSYKNLKIVQYCGYYMEECIEEIFESGKYPQIDFVPIF